MTELQDIAWKLQNEGMGYAILYYFGENKIQNNPDIPEEVKDAWTQARTSLRTIEDFFDQFS